MSSTALPLRALVLRALLLLAIPTVFGVGARAAWAEPPPEESALLEVRASREEVYVGEPFTVSLTLRLDRAWFAEHAVPLFRRPLDVPVQVEAPWLAAIPGARLLSGEPLAEARRRTLAIGDAVLEAREDAEQTRGERTYTVLVIERRYLPEQAGEISLAAPTLRFAWASRFEEDFLGGRTALDRRQAEVPGTERSIRVRDLPAEGRPPGYAGLVGAVLVRAEAEAEAETAAAEVARALPLTITLTAADPTGSNLAYVPLPPLVLPGFHVFGLREEVLPGTRILRYDVAPLSAGVTEIPSIPFPYFDPGPRAYGVARTLPLPLAVRTDGAARGTGEAAAPGDESSRSGDAWWIVLATCVLTGLLGWFAWRRLGRSAEAPDPRRARFEDAKAAFRAGRAGPHSELADLFAEVLGARLGCPRAAVIAPDLASRLATAGIAPDVAARTAATLERLVAARYGGTATPEDAATAEALLDHLAPGPVGGDGHRPARAG